MSLSPIRPILLAQIGLVALGGATLAFYPPPSGAIAMVALDGRDAAHLVRDAVADGALPIGRGPLSNILLVQGNRDRLRGSALADGVLLIAAPRSWCGAAVAQA